MHREKRPGVCCVIVDCKRINSSFFKYKKKTVHDDEKFELVQFSNCTCVSVCECESE